jgi:hypothetical protein
MFKACFDEGEIMVSNLLWFSLFFFCTYTCALKSCEAELC